MNLSSVLVLLGVGAEVALLAFVVIRGRRRWLQAMYAACSLSFLVSGVAFVGTNEAILVTRADLIVGIMLLAPALTSILVLGLIHGETLPRRRPATFLVLAPVPLLAYLTPTQGWTAATAYEGNLLGGFLVLCLGIALAEAIYARYSSRLFAAHAFWLSLGVISLIVAGPIYAYELEFLGQVPIEGANFGAPVALACFALVAIQADPLPVSSRLPKGRARPSSRRDEEALVFDESRPKYALRTAHEESFRGRATLIVARTPPPMTASGPALASILPGRHAALRTLTTASEFLAVAPGGLVVIADLADLSALSGWRPTLESVVRLRHVARGTGSTVIFSTSRLTEPERLALKERQLTWWTLPDPASEIEAIFGQSFGAGAGRLLESFCRSHGLRREAVTTDHVPALLAFLDRARAELSGVVAGTAAHGLRVQFEAAASVLRSFADQGAEEVARGKWPSRRASGAGGELLITAAEYWKGKEMEELFAAAETVGGGEPLFEKARSVFVEQLGDAGESMLRTQVSRLGKRPEDLDKGDLALLADRASVDLENLAAIVDVPQEKDRIRKQVESIRHRLERLVEEDG